MILRQQSDRWYRVGRKAVTSYNNVVRLLGFQSTPAAEGNSYFVKTNILGSLDIRRSFLHNLLKEIHARHHDIANLKEMGNARASSAGKSSQLDTCSIVGVVEGGGSKPKIFAQFMDHRSCSSVTLGPTRLETRYEIEDVRTEIQLGQ